MLLSISQWPSFPLFSFFFSPSILPSLFLTLFSSLSLPPVFFHFLRLSFARWFAFLFPSHWKLVNDSIVDRFEKHFHISMYIYSHSNYCCYFDCCRAFVGVFFIWITFRLSFAMFSPPFHYLVSHIYFPCLFYSTAAVHSVDSLKIKCIYEPDPATATLSLYHSLNEAKQNKKTIKKNHSYRRVG